MQGEGLTGRPFRRFAAWAAFAAAVGALLYSIAFVVLRDALAAAILLEAGGLVSVVALVGLYSRIRESDIGPAELGLAFGVAGTLGAAIHGGFDLAVVLHPPQGTAIGLPNPVDPRGLLTFGVSGLGILVLSWASRATGGWPRGLGLLGLVLGVTMIVVYLGRLVVLDATSPLILAPAALAGVVLAPLWYGWLGRELLRG